MLKKRIGAMRIRNMDKEMERPMRPRLVSIWFSDEISTWRAFWFTEYMQSSVVEPRAGYVQEVFYTKHIDLTQEEKQILAAFSPNTRREIARATREGIEMHESADLEEFVPFFNKFAENKGLDYRVKRETFRKTRSGLRLFKAIKDGHTIAMHLYVCDYRKARVRLLYSASLLRDEGKVISNAIIGVANKAAHFHEMRLFKQQGFRILDFGGYAYQTQDPDLIKINFFKDSFGGELVREANFRSFPLHLASCWFQWRNKSALLKSLQPKVLNQQKDIGSNRQLPEFGKGAK